MGTNKIEMKYFNGEMKIEWTNDSSLLCSMLHCELDFNNN